MREIDNIFLQYTRRLIWDYRLYTSISTKEWVDTIEKLAKAIEEKDRATEAQCRIRMAKFRVLMKNEEREYIHKLMVQVV